MSEETPEVIRCEYCLKTQLDPPMTWAHDLESKKAIQEALKAAGWGGTLIDSEGYHVKERRS